MPELAAVNPIDAVLVLLVLAAAWGGWRSGFVAAVLQLMAFLASMAAAYLGYPYTAAWLRALMPRLDEAWALPIGFLASFLVFFAVLAVLGRALAWAAPAHVHGHAVNRALGVLPGLTNGFIHATIVALLLLTAPLVDSVSRMAGESALASRLSAPAEWLESALAPILEPIRRARQAVTVPPESRASINLRFTVANPNVRPDLEARMLEMVNAEREIAAREHVAAMGTGHASCGHNSAASASACWTAAGAA